MKMAVGMSDSTGMRRVIVAEADPTLKEIVEVTLEGDDGVDWGRAATTESRERLAALILGVFAPEHHTIGGQVVERFASEIIAEMESMRMWIITGKYVEEWIARVYLV